MSTQDEVLNQDELSTQDELKARSYGCYVTIKNRSAQDLLHVRYGKTTGRYAKKPTSEIASGRECSFHLEGSGSWINPEGSEATITYDVSDDVGLGTVDFYYTDPYLGPNKAEAPTVSPVIKTSVYAQEGTKTNWGDDPSKWGKEGQVPVDGHPIAILFVVDDIT